MAALFDKSINLEKCPMSTAAQRAEVPNDLEAFWMPFTPNRAWGAVIFCRRKSASFFLLLLALVLLLDYCLSTENAQR